jgi:hypothetical protein
MTTCRIERILGPADACPADRCAFWERGECAFRRVDLAENHEVADWLLEMRRTLESLRTAEDRHRFHALLSSSSE